MPGEDTTMENTATMLLAMSSDALIVSNARLSCCSGMGRKNPCTTGALTWIEGLVSGVFVPSVASVAVIVQLPMLSRVATNVAVPLTNASSGGMVALGSVVSRCTTSVAALTRFQSASTALTITGKEIPAACPSGVPVLPVGVPGAAVSPGSSTCSLTNMPPPRTTGADVAGVRAPLVNWMVMVVATGCDKSANVAIPPTAASAVVPCKVPVPALRAAVTVSASFARKLP